MISKICEGKEPGGHACKRLIQEAWGLRKRYSVLSLRPAETCLYTVAPDEHFLVDFLPGRSDVIVASPCAGHGFKFSCLIGQVLADMATGGPGNKQGELDLVPAWKSASPS